MTFLIMCILMHSLFLLIPTNNCTQFSNGKSHDFIIDTDSIDSLVNMYNVVMHELKFYYYFHVVLTSYIIFVLAQYILPLLDNYLRPVECTYIVTTYYPCIYSLIKDYNLYTYTCTQKLIETFLLVNLYFNPTSDIFC